ncbi:hypothetical protein [Ekhidna sp.]|jgi:hypothetical protein|uniref:toxin-antitoxin system YwqK family antitoxin n=1 Tax=Ekhidna sp. TaxID=2608089 RepID=UPI0032EF30EF
MNKNQILLALVILSFVGMSAVYLDVSEIISSEILGAKPKSKEKHGEVRQYTKSNKLKTIVNYDHGQKHGTSYLFHDDGETILLAMPYENGEREGVSKKYYENGQLYAATSYREDKLHGPRKLYYSTGQLKAEIPYGYGFPGIGTREFLIDGKEKEALTITTKTDGSIIWLDTSEPCDDQRFYIGQLVDDNFLDPVNEDVRLLMENDNQFFVDTKVYTPSYLKYQDIICHCESSQGNPIILKTRISL